MKLQSTSALNLPSLDSVESLDIGRCLDFLRYLQSLDATTADAGRVKAYIEKIKRRILLLVNA
jgi:hypothetical protein